MPDRLSAFDLAELAADVGPNPRTIGVLLEIEGPTPPIEAVRAAVADRLGYAPRLAQRMRATPFGSGRPLWHDVEPDLAHHIRPCRAEATCLNEIATRIAAEPLDPERPWWTLTVIDLGERARFAAVWSSHHAMADGPSVLRAVSLVLGAAQPCARRALRADPSGVELFREAWRERVRSVGRGLVRLPRDVVGLRELAASTGKRAAVSVVNHPVSAGYTLRTVDLDVSELRAGARSCGATINDALLWAWGSALHGVLERHGQTDARLVIACTVTRPSAAIENHVGSVRFVIPPSHGDVADELALLARDTRRRKRRISGSTWWPLAQVFRLVGAVGGYRTFVEHQRAITSLLTNVRGPDEPLRLLGGTVTRAVPIAPLVGNVTALASALSHGGRLVVSIMCSPESARESDRLASDVKTGLDRIAALAAPVARRPEGAMPA